MADRTVTEAAFDYAAASASSNRPQVGVVVSYCREVATWQAHPVTASVTVGRDESADVAIDDRGVSRVHARLENRGTALLVTDAGSRNGTFVNAERVGSEGALAPVGSVLRMNRTLLVVVPDVKPFLGERAKDFPGLVGGASLDDARTVIDTIAPTNMPILILGETGTGKEVIASVLHGQSGRTGAFVALNCAAVPSELIDAELFGHSRGAFSGAVSARPGLFRTADHGTLFLDELGELPASLQAKLLRVLETQQVRAVGEDRVVSVDVRVVAATNRDVDAMADNGDFRSDLLHRLAGLRIVLPALRERIEDLPALCLHFLRDSGMGISVAALERLMLHAWPGNVRELNNVSRASCEIARRAGHTEVEPSDVAKVMGATTARAGQQVLEAELCARVTRELTEARGSVNDAAQRLGMSRSVLYETLRRLRLDPKAFRPR